MANKNDAKVKELLALVEKQEAEIKGTKRRTLVTNGVFPDSQSGKGMKFNLNTVTDPVILVNALAEIMGIKANFDAAAKELEVNAEFKWGNYTIEEWTEDFKDKIVDLQIKAKKKLLAKTKKQLKDLRSEDAKTEDALSDIKDVLGL